MEETKLASHYFKFQSERKRTHIIWITESLELHLVEANRSVPVIMYGKQLVEATMPEVWP